MAWSAGRLPTAPSRASRPDAAGDDRRGGEVGSITIEADSRSQKKSEVAARGRAPLETSTPRIVPVGAGKKTR
jgi:hypothetical protein